VHILQLTDLYRPVIGGLERYVETLSGELIRLGHSVTVVTLRSGDLPAEETIDGVRVIRIRGWTQHFSRCYADAAHPFHPTAPDPGTMAELRRVLTREQPDVVHSHGWLQYSYFPLYRRHQGPAHVVSLHDYGLACARKTLMLAGQAGQCPGPRLTRCLACAPEQYGVLKGMAIPTALRASRALHRRADRYTATSTAVAEGSRPALPTGTEISVIHTMVPNGTAILAQTTPKPEFLPPDDGYLMFVGALGPHKGIDVLLEARRRMRHRRPLLVIGTPRHDTPLISDPGVVVVRNVPSAQVMASWLRASVAVVPSVWQEPLGLVAVEAMLAGRPVVASDVGGLRDVVRHGCTGLVVPPGNPGALADALDGLLDNPELRRRMGEEGRVRGRLFEAAAVTPRIVQVFEAALRDRTRGAPV
jgi:glycosyltransferase involved in cell wall biosynthesis